jgi:vitamin B12/bleomycin/antimicrobial peptide transport system ATP-binding/permease protein
MGQKVEPVVGPTQPALGSVVGFLRLALGFWRGRTARAAWLLCALISALLLLNLAVNVGFNRWNRWFFDALEHKQRGMIAWAFVMLAGLILLGAALAVAMIRSRMRLQISWREWVTEQLLQELSVHLSSGVGHVANENHGSPAYRIAEDVRLALDPVVELAIGFCNAIILGATFAGILIVIGGSFQLGIGGMQVSIPAYLALAALFYAMIVSSAMYLVGRPLIRRIAAKNEAEAQFLFELNHATETLYRPASTTRAGSIAPVRTTFKTVINSWQRVVREYGHLTWISNSSIYFAPALPLLLIAPKYVAGDLSLGAVMQLATAFTVVLGALNWFTDNYVRIAEWSASARRVDELRGSFRRSATEDFRANERSSSAPTSAV